MGTFDWGGLAQGVIGGISSFFGGERANDASAAQAHANREFQYNVLRQSHQIASTDLQAAGLNRILSATQGGASSAAGSMARQEDTVTPAINTALAARRQSEEIKTLQETRRGISAESDMKEYARDYEAERYSAADAITDKDGNVVVTPMMNKIIREELNARMAAARAGQEQPGATVELTKMQTLLSKMQSGGQDLTNQEKQLLVNILRAAQPGNLDEAKLWSSSAGDLRRRSDMAADGLNKWLPWGGFGQRNSARKVEHTHRRVP